MRTIILFIAGLFIFQSCLPGDPGMTDQLIYLRADSLGGYYPVAKKSGDYLMFQRDSAGVNSLWLMELDNERKELVYSSTNEICCADFSHNGKYIFFNEFNPDPDLFRLNLDGTRLIPLTDNDLYEGQSVSTLDDKILFTSEENGVYGIYEINDEGTGRIRLHDAEFELADPAVSNNGQYVLGIHQVNPNNTDIYRIEIDSQEIIKLTESDSAEISPVWSPADDLIAFVNNRYGKWDIYTIQPDGSGITRITERETEDISPTFSPCGKYILYQSRGGVDEPFDIWVMKSDGSNRRPITQDNFNNIEPVWAAGGDKIYYTTIVDGIPQVMSINFDGSERNLVTLALD